MSLVNTIWSIMFVLACVGVAGFCLNRAMVMDGRAKLAPRLAFVGLFMSSVAGILSLVFLWDRSWIMLGFVVSVLTLMYASRELWAGGTPDFVLKVSERWPAKERRAGGDRRGTKAE